MSSCQGLPLSRHLRVAFGYLRAALGRLRAKLGQARGAAIVAATNKGLSVAEYSARQIKQAVVGTGAADKAQVQHMVKNILNLPGTPQADAADALAVALCHGHSQDSLNKMVGQVTKTVRGRLR